MKIELNLIELKETDTEIAYSDKIVGKDIIQVLSQFPFCVARLMKFMHDNELSRLSIGRGLEDDDIPF